MLRLERPPVMAWQALQVQAEQAQVVRALITQLARVRMVARALPHLFLGRPLPMAAEAVEEQRQTPFR